MKFLEKIYAKSFLGGISGIFIIVVKTTLCILLLSSHIALSQVSVINRSFEDQPSDATIPQGWFGCKALTTPDILPGFWGVYNEPTDGKTYIGLITREDGSWESIGQRLTATLELNACYIFTLDLAHSFIYAGYSQPIKLRIWLGQNLCDKSQLIFESPYIDDEKWKTYNIKFTTENKFDFIILEAFKGDVSDHKKGNILLDNMGTLKFCGRA